MVDMQVATSWQAHGAKLEAVRAEFQTDAQSIRDILRLWQRHGTQINTFLESSQANGTPNGNHPGLPAVSPATDKDSAPLPDCHAGKCERARLLQALLELIALACPSLLLQSELFCSSCCFALSFSTDVSSGIPPCLLLCSVCVLQGAGLLLC